MANKYQSAYTGYYKHHFLRSYPEFIYALYLDLVLKVKFETEPFSLHSANSNKRKIPDFAYLESGDKYFLPHDVIRLVEIKSSQEEAEKTIVHYATYKFIPDHDLIQVSFIAITNKSKRLWINKIVDVIGKTEFDKLSDEFKMQRKDRLYTGFPGTKNPNYGIKNTPEKNAKTKATRIANNTWDVSGNKNPNFGGGANYSEDARKRIGAKWQDLEKKNFMKKKGMINHFQNITSENKTILKSYLVDTLINNIGVKRPDFINFAYTVNKEKIINLFGSIDDFFKEVQI